MSRVSTLKFGGTIFAGAILSVAMTVSVTVEAKPKTVAEIADYRAADRQAVLEAGARKEGTLLIYAVGTQIRPVMKAFKEKYPFIEYQLFRAGSTKIARKVIEEYKAGFNKVDGFELNVAALTPIRDIGALTPYYSPQAKNYPKEAMEAKKHWIIVRESYIGLGYNTKLVSEAEAPRTYKDLLSPKWKGRMAISGRGSSVANFVGAMILHEGEDFVRALGKQNIAVFKLSGRAMASLVVSGEVAISPMIYNSHMANSRRKGADVAWRALGPVYASITATAIAAKSNNPHSAMLLADFLLSKEGQKIYRKLGYASARKDMKTKDAVAKKMYLAHRPNYLSDYKKWKKLAGKVFGRARKRKKSKK